MMADPKDLRPRRGVRSFVRREGRMTPGQEHALVELWPRYGIDADALRRQPLPHFFGREAASHLEIGCGNGDTLLALAQTHADNNCLGIEVHRPGLGSLLRRADKLGLRNIRLLNGDATETLALLPPHEFERICVFFPDPWPKKRHHKRRLLQPDFARMLCAKLAAHGRLFLATDWEDYALQMMEVMRAIPGMINLAGVALWSPRPHWRPITRYEQRALKLGHHIYDLAYGHSWAG
jgi:tRNA (guanine-N7-)-methyltransferase